MANPIRFPKGVSTYSPRATLASFPSVPTPSQVVVAEDFLPYRATDYTVTTAVAGTIATFPQLAGAIKLATSASGTDTIFAMRAGQAFQFMALNQFWFNVRLAYPRTVLNANDTNIYAGLMDAATFALANNGIFFQKVAGGTAVALVIKKAGTTTTFNNIADFALPSGLFGDTNSVNGVLSATIAGTAFTGVTVNTAGSGYECSPLVLTTTTAGGTTGSTPIVVGLGASALSATNPQFPVNTTGLMYGSLYAPVVSTPGSGFTNAGPLTTLLEVVPFIDLSLYYNGKDTLYVGVNGRQVLSIGPGGVGTFAAGGTVNAATALGTPSFFPTTALTSAVSPVLPIAGSAYNVLPLTTLNAIVGFTNTTANIRTLYVDDYLIAEEFN